MLKSPIINMWFCWLFLYPLIVSASFVIWCVCVHNCLLWIVAFTIVQVHSFNAFWSEFYFDVSIRRLLSHSFSLSGLSLSIPLVFLSHCFQWCLFYKAYIWVLPMNHFEVFFILIINPYFYVIDTFGFNVSHISLKITVH